MTRTETVGVEGLFTAECGLGVEKRLMSLAGVKRAAVNSVAGTATVEFDEKSIGLEAIKAAVRDCGYGCSGRQLPHHVCKPDDDPPPAAAPAASPAGEARDKHAEHGAGHGAAATAAARVPAAAARDEMAHEMGHGAGKDMAGMVRDMRNRFLVCLAFTIPLFFWAPM